MHAASQLPERGPTVLQNKKRLFRCPMGVPSCYIKMALIKGKALNGYSMSVNIIGEKK